MPLKIDSRVDCGKYDLLELTIEQMSPFYVVAARLMDGEIETMITIQRFRVDTIDAITNLPRGCRVKIEHQRNHGGDGGDRGGQM